MEVKVNTKLTTEQMMNAKFDRQVESYKAKFSNLFESMAKSPSFKGSINKNTIHCLGSQLERFKQYEAYVKESGGGSAASLGTLPTVALDLITASYGLSVAPQLASVQSIDNDQDLIYFKKIFTLGYPTTSTNGLQALPETRYMKADGTMDGDPTMHGSSRTWGYFKADGTPGTLTADNYDATTFHALNGWVSDPTNYVSERQVAAFPAATTAGGSTQTTLTNANGRIRWNVPVKVRLVTDDGMAHDLVGMSSGPNDLPKFYGDIAVVAAVSGENLTITATSPTGKKITGGLALYDVDFEKAADVPAIEFALDTKMVTAQIMGVKEQLGTFKSFQFNKRFGSAATDEQLADLSGHMAMAESVKVITAYKQAADKIGSPIVWNMNKPVGISEYEHRQSLKYALQAASSKIGQRCGRGYINRLVAGYKACEYIGSLPEFKKSAETSLIGPHVFGTLDGVTVIRSNVVVAPNEIIGGFVNEASPFEAPVVCATYMPVFLTDTLPVANNPFLTQRAIASWKAIEPVVNEFVQRIVLVQTSDAPADMNVYYTTNPNPGSSNA